jgi:hypothetical protein
MIERGKIACAEIFITEVEKTSKNVYKLKLTVKLYNYFGKWTEKLIGDVLNKNCAF